MTAIMYAPTPYASFNASSGNLYQADAFQVISNVATLQDIEDLKTAGCILLSAGTSSARPSLDATLNLYVRKDGNDANSGLANTAEGALLTVQAAFDKIYLIDTAGYLVNIYVDDGVYDEDVTFYSTFGFQFIGLYGTGYTLVSIRSIDFAFGVTADLSGITFTKADGNQIGSRFASLVSISGDVMVGGTTAACCNVTNFSRLTVPAGGRLLVQGTSARCLQLQIQCTFEIGATGGTIEFIAGCEFTAEFMTLNRFSNARFLKSGGTFTGTFTGENYTVSRDSSFSGLASLDTEAGIPGTIKGSFQAAQFLPRINTKNLAYNGEGILQQGPAGAIADDTYGLHNRWYGLTQSGTMTPTSIAGPSTEVPSLMRLTNSHGSSQRMIYAQILEGVDTIPLRGQSINLSGWINTVTSINPRLLILAWVGSIDAVPSDFVLTWTSTNFTNGNFYIADANMVPLYSLTQGNSSGGRYFGNTATVVVPDTCNNLIISAFSSAVIPAGDYIDIRIQLELGENRTTFEYTPIQKEEIRCGRYYQSFTVQSENGSRHIPFNQKMRIAPAVAVGVGAAAAITPDGFELAHVAAAACTVVANAEL